MAHSRVLRESLCCTTMRVQHDEETVLGSYGRRTSANRLAADESRGVIGEYVIQRPMPLPLHILQLLLGHPKIVPQFMYESLANLMTHFGLA
jgi:hypothetical protein